MKIPILLALTALPALVLTTAGLLSTTASAQKTLHVTHGCAYKTAAEDTDLYTFESSAESERIASEICNAVGLSQNFDIRASNVENAMAVVDGSRRVILYSNVFLKKFNEDARTRWAAYSVLAHEIGHHLNNHDFAEPNPGKRKVMELEADRFSGSALRLLGATLSEAKAGVETFALAGEQTKHPSAKARLESLTTGWNQQQERLEKMGAGIPTPDSNIPRERDTDGDGIPDRNDGCPDEYGRSLTAGCPDGDEDGIPDSEDKCRYLKGPAQWKGCPDSDGDGLPDHEDRCPKEPGYLTDGGCPPPDRDGDSVTDRADKCPDAYGLARFQGCPDTDEDGVPDSEDKCPKEKGEPMYDGCVRPKLPESLERSGSSMPDNLVLVQGGTFIMGDQFNDVTTERTHSVTLGSFYMGKTEVTFNEFDAFCTDISREKPSDSGWGRGSRPVINVDWYDAVEYCNWRSQKENLSPAYTIDKTRQDPNNQNNSDTKKWTVSVNWAAKGYRLPTEAEWEYAAREGGKKIRFGNGRDIADPTQINFNGSDGYKKDYSVVGEYRRETVPVDEIAGAANRLGLRHMSGNVYEWCHDWYDLQYYSKSSGASNPKGPDNGDTRIVRGGCFGFYPKDCRSTDRYSRGPNPSYPYVGFRVVRLL